MNIGELCACVYDLTLNLTAIGGSAHTAPLLVESIALLSGHWVTIAAVEREEAIHEKEPADE